MKKYMKNGKKRGVMYISILVIMMIATYITSGITILIKNKSQIYREKKKLIEDEISAQNIFNIGEAYLYSLDKKMIKGEIESIKKYFFGEYKDFERNIGEYKLKELKINGNLGEKIYFNNYSSTEVNIVMTKILILDINYRIEVLGKLYYKEKNYNVESPDKEEILGVNIYYD